MYRAIVSCSCALALVGCGKAADPNKPKLVPASGIVTYKGAPIEGATVLFSPMVQTGGLAASAMTKADGGFVMSNAYPGENGVPAGAYKIMVSKTAFAEAPPAPARHDAPPVIVPPPKPLLPPKYGQSRTTPLKVEIPATGKTDIKLDLND